MPSSSKWPGGIGMKSNSSGRRVPNTKTKSKLSSSSTKNYSPSSKNNSTIETISPTMLSLSMRFRKRPKYNQTCMNLKWPTKWPIPNSASTTSKARSSNPKIPSPWPTSKEKNNSPSPSATKARKNSTGRDRTSRINPYHPYSITIIRNSNPLPLSSPKPPRR